MVPSHSASTTRPLLAALSISASPSTSARSPLASPLADERRPLLRSVRSFGPEDLKRRSVRLLSDALFSHSDAFDEEEQGSAVRGGGLENTGNEDHDRDCLTPISPVSTSVRGRPFSKSRASYLGGGSLKRVGMRRGYDGDFRREFEGEGGNGVRSWYDNFHTIDWIHDAIKHSLRLRRLRLLKHTQGLRGRLLNFWDGLQGWLLVTLIGICTALIAFCIISSEMVLFDLKEGYCAGEGKSWRTAKRFCCRAGSAKPPLTNGTSLVGSYTMSGWAAQQTVMTMEEGQCPDWRTWADVWDGWTGDDSFAGDAVAYVAYVLIALAFSTLASTLTIYFTSSTSVFSSKDSPSIPHAGFSPEFVSACEGGMYGAVGGEGEGAGGGPGVVLQQRPRKTLYFAAGSGIPEIKTILSGFVIRGYLGSWTLGVKAVGLALSVASGLSLGKEGPFVHISSCVGNILSRFFPKYDKNEAKRREVLSAACAAGVAVSFGAPVGGVLFSLEEVSYFFPPRTMLRSFWCAMVAAMSLKLLDPFRSGKIVLFEVTYDRDWHALELAGFLFLAVFGGVYGACFCRANIAWTKKVRNGTFLKGHPIVEVGLVTLLTALISLHSPWTRMGGTELISALFSECQRDQSLPLLCPTTPSLAWPLIRSILLALLIKAALTVVTFGIKLPAGIFIPTLAVGACAGRVAGLLVEIAHARWPMATVFEACRPSGGEGGPLAFGQACVVPGVWAMVGAAATLAGVTRTTVSLVVIVMELTGTLTYSVPTMLAVVLAKTVADRIEPRSIYDLVIEVADLPYLDSKTEYIHDSTPADILDSEAPTISLDAENTVGSLRAQLAALYSSGTASGFPIVGLTHDEPSAVGRRMYAYIASKELEHGLALASSRGLPDDAPISFRTAMAAAKGVPVGAMSYQSGAVTPVNGGGMDFSYLTDSAPLTVSVRSPMELLHEMFIKLGVRHLIITDERGLYLGSLEKNRYLAYLRYLEKHAEERGKEHGRRRGREVSEAGV
ncbi:hypothetical protein JCM11251_000528 [Rhodosporidiobolus azoricus]